jgi:hypothetical protein
MKPQFHVKMEMLMKEKLIQVYQLLNQISVQGQQSVISLGIALETLQKLLQEIEEEERENAIAIDNKKGK